MIFELFSNGSSLLHHRDVRIKIVSAALLILVIALSHASVTPPADPPVAVLPPQVTQLAVVRYNWTPKSGNDSFTYQFEQAVAAGLERAGGTPNYVFFRQPAAVRASVHPVMPSSAAPATTARAAWSPSLARC